jgi:hypothetical protein
VFGRWYATVHAAAMGLVLSFGSSPSSATPRPLPFTYPAQTVPQGTLEVEQYLDLVPVRVAREDADGTRAVTSLRSVLQTELEYGFTDRLGGAFYFVFRQNASASSPVLTFQGVKQRLRYELSERGVWPIDVGLYGEIAEFHNELEFEEKILLSRRFGAFSAACNLWVEQEYYFQIPEWRFIYNPTLGATYDLSPNFVVGLEYWVRGRFDDDDGGDSASLATPAAIAAESEVPSGAHHYLGPTFMAQTADAFFTLGAYARLDHLGDAAVVGDQYGKLWFRVLIGVHL